MSSLQFSILDSHIYSQEQIEPFIHHAWEQRQTLTPQEREDLSPLIESILDYLDQGLLRICEKRDGDWYIHQWLKKAILLSFRLRSNTLYTQGPKDQEESRWFDKVPLKCQGWTERHFQNAGFRLVPGAIVRQSAYIASDAVIMPSFINVGAHIGRNTLIDTWVTIGSCAQIGAHCHISGGVGIGGVLEPLQASPVIIEDNCFIGARSEIAEGVIVEEGSVISMGVFLGASTKIVNRQTGDITMGRIPPYSVVIPGTLPASNGTGPSLACAVIVKQVDERTRSKTSINELLRAYTPESV